MKKVIFYGMGEKGRIVCNQYLSRNEVSQNIQVIGWSDKEDGRIKFANKKINYISPSNISKYEFDAIVICSTKFYKEIKKDLIKNKKINDKKIYEYKHFFEINFEKKYLCNFCNKKSPFFESIGNDYNIFYEQHIVGGGYRENGICPICGTHDRIRWILIVLERYTSILSKACTVLHIAPEKSLGDKIKENTLCEYLTGDIVLGKAQYQVDVTDMQFQNNKFDYIICNHVLEHVDNCEKAISEFKRCLKKNGKLILSFPVCLDKRTFEDNSIKEDDEKIKYYGQSDHCRLFGYDTEDYLKKQGLRVSTIYVKEELTENEIEMLALIREDRTYICSKLEN